MSLHEGQSIALQDQGIGLAAEGLRIRLDGGGGVAVVLHECGMGRAAAEGLEGESPASREQVEHPDAVEVQAGGEHVEDRFLDPVGGRAHGKVPDGPELTALEASGDHPHAYSLRRATPTAAANR